jgi:hypothetical protein
MRRSTTVFGCFLRSWFPRGAVAVLAVVTSTAPARAGLPDPVDPETIADGGSVTTSGGLLGETTGGSAGAAGEMASVASWTRPGEDGVEGFRGPRWTNRWGARMYGLASFGSGDRPLTLEERGEVALYGGSLGQTVTWQSGPRLTDTFWYRTNARLTAGAFVDFAGLGLVKDDDGDTLDCEGLPVYAAFAQDVTGDAPARTLSLDVAMARVVGRRGDLRLVDEHLTVRLVGSARELELTASAFSVRRLELAPHSRWTWSADILGMTAIEPMGRSAPMDDPWGAASSVMPHVRVGIAHHGSAYLRAERSELGRPVLDDLDFGGEVGTMHRVVDGRGLDEGGEALAWWRRAVARHVTMRGEVMIALADRVLVPGMMLPGGLAPWIAHSELIALTRGELELSAQLGRGFALQARAWMEHSERTDVAQPARWTSGVQSGIAVQM